MREARSLRMSAYRASGGADDAADDEFEDAASAAAPTGAAARRARQKRVSLVLTVPAADVRRWWPNGYGDAHLYDLRVSAQIARVADDDGAAAAAVGGADVAAAAGGGGPALGLKQLATRRVGLRTVELVQEPRPANSYGKTGKSFFFRVNGVDVFAKGSNYIPADVFQPRVTEGYLDVRHDAPLCCNLCPSTFVKLTIILIIILHFVICVLRRS